MLRLSIPAAAPPTQGERSFPGHRPAGARMEASGKSEATEPGKRHFRGRNCAYQTFLKYLYKLKPKCVRSYLEVRFHESSDAP